MNRASLHALSATVVALIACVLLTACSTTGRELRDTGATIPPSMDATTTTAPPPDATPVEGLNGFALSSPDFVAGGLLPQSVGAITGNRSPALAWTGTPESAAELALVATDETGGTIYWFVTGILTTDMQVAAGTAPEGAVVRAGTNGREAWSGPVTPEGSAAPVVFALYALNEPLVPTDGETSHALRERMIDGSFATATIRGTFSPGSARTTAAVSPPSTTG
jgi:phosphatidylethanolamine-binding protein (PEBP) family uncharacterized protein